jgi:hypothetical protein
VLPFVVMIRQPPRIVPSFSFRLLSTARHLSQVTYGRRQLYTPAGTNILVTNRVDKYCILRRKCAISTPIRSTKMDSTVTTKNALHGHSSDLEIELTAPNGRRYMQPLGLFINGEFVKSSNGQKLSTINPTYNTTFPRPCLLPVDGSANESPAVTRPKLPQYMRPLLKT